MKKKKKEKRRKSEAEAEAETEGEKASGKSSQNYFFSRILFYAFVCWHFVRPEDVVCINFICALRITSYFARAHCNMFLFKRENDTEGRKFGFFVDPFAIIAHKNLDLSFRLGYQSTHNNIDNH